MRAMVLNKLGNASSDSQPLDLMQLPDPAPQEKAVLLRVTACGVCHTELDEIEGRTRPPRLPVIPGHQVVGRVTALGAGAGRFGVGERVGVAWIHSACGRCRYCLSGNENLCPEFRATGRDVNGGYAEYMTVPEAFAYRIPDSVSDVEAAPLLCAGAVGYRALRLTGLVEGQALGLTGFGASGHLVLAVVRHTVPNARVYVFARSEVERAFARERGAVWAGDTEAVTPEKLDAIIDTTPAWKPVLAALRCLRPGGRLVINAIRKEDSDKASLRDLDYSAHLWMEKEIKSVANVARSDVQEFLDVAAEIPIRPTIEEFALEEANTALRELRSHSIRGAKVLHIR